ncbi:MAG: hypothetical protein FGM46_06665 [Ferruginibacter sp.]|nr:hypothetical protein [Ferruginibacter sp.]
MIRLLHFFFFSCLFLMGYAQPNLQEQKKIETKIQPLGALEAYNLATITDTITKPFFDKREKALAIYYWIANHITISPESVRSYDSRDTDPASVIKNRKTNAIGFSLLFQEMCSMANIRCLFITGYTKYNTDEINEPADEPNHAWNVVQIGLSPDTWYYVDASKACGITDTKFYSFTKKFNWNYFFSDKNIFNLDHFPENRSWILGKGSKSKKEFYSIPVVESGAYQLGTYHPIPYKGFIKTKTSKPVAFSIKRQRENPIWKIFLIIKIGNKEAKKIDLQFKEEYEILEFEYTFDVEDTYVVTINADGNDLYTYVVESEE